MKLKILKDLEEWKR